MKANLSIIVANYNKPPEQLMDCMDSIKDQTVSPLEVILVDDCSKDPRAHALAVSIILPKNMGVAKARDIGVRMSKGKLLLFLDADDKLAPDFIEKCGRALENYDIAYTNSILFGNVEKNKLKEPPFVLEPKHLMNRKCEILVTSMFQRSMYDKLGGFRKMSIYEDWDFWIRAMFNGYTFGRAETFLWYRQNKGSRNRSTRELKSDIYNKITAPYELKGGKIVERK